MFAGRVRHSFISLPNHLSEKLHWKSNLLTSHTSNRLITITAATGILIESLFGPSISPLVSNSIPGGPQLCTVLLQPYLNASDPANQVLQDHQKLPSKCDLELNWELWPSRNWVWDHCNLLLFLLLLMRTLGYFIIIFFYQYIYYFHINNLQIEYSLQVDILF